MKKDINKKKKHRFSLKKSIQFRFTVIVILILIASIGVTVFLNLNFLESYYRNNKKKAAIKEIAAVNEIMSRYKFTGSSDDLDDDMSDEINDILDECWKKYNMSCFIVGTDDDTLFTTSIKNDDLQFRLQQYVFDKDIDKQTLYSNSSYQIVLMKGKGDRDTYLDAFGYFDNQCSFLISMPVESIRESVSLSNRFFMSCGIIVAILAGIIMFFMMRRLTKPIQELSCIAECMARQEFDVTYKGNEQDEIGQLGVSMNLMSIELEKTINELKEANEQLTKDIEEKIQIDEMRKEFLSNVSHELKTPIAIIQGYAEGLQDCVNDDEESRAFYCDVIMDEAAKMNEMVQKLLRLNKLEFGNSILDKIVFDMDEMIRGMMNTTQVLLKDRDAHMVYENHASKQLVSGDEFMIEEVLKNYISNACHYVSNGGLVKILASDGSENHMKISVFNEGSHIPEESLDKVWVKFYKVDKARTREYGGSGIGLSIVKAIMEQHGCRYGVLNKDNGVEFWFEMEYAKEDEIDSDFE